MKEPGGEGVEPAAGEAALRQVPSTTDEDEWLRNAIAGELPAINRRGFLLSLVGTLPTSAMIVIAAQGYNRFVLLVLPMLIAAGFAAFCIIERPRQIRKAERDLLARHRLIRALLDDPDDPVLPEVDVAPRGPGPHAPPIVIETGRPASPWVGPPRGQ